MLNISTVYGKQVYRCMYKYHILYFVKSKMPSTISCTIFMYSKGENATK